MPDSINYEYYSRFAQFVLTDVASFYPKVRWYSTIFYFQSRLTSSIVESHFDRNRKVEKMVKIIFCILQGCFEQVLKWEIDPSDIPVCLYRFICFNSYNSIIENGIVGVYYLFDSFNYNMLTSKCTFHFHTMEKIFLSFFY